MYLNDSVSLLVLCLTKTKLLQLSCSKYKQVWFNCASATVQKLLLVQIGVYLLINEFVFVLGQKIISTLREVVVKIPAYFLYFFIFAFTE